MDVFDPYFLPHQCFAGKGCLADPAEPIVLLCDLFPGSGAFRCFPGDASLDWLYWIQHSDHGVWPACIPEAAAELYTVLIEGKGHGRNGK